MVKLIDKKKMKKFFTSIEFIIFLKVILNFFFSKELFIFDIGIIIFLAKQKYSIYELFWSAFEIIDEFLFSGFFTFIIGSIDDDVEEIEDNDKDINDVDFFNLDKNKYKEIVDKLNEINANIEKAGDIDKYYAQLNDDDLIIFNKINDNNIASVTDDDSEIYD